MLSVSLIFFGLPLSLPCEEEEHLDVLSRIVPPRAVNPALCRGICKPYPMLIPCWYEASHERSERGRCDREKMKEARKMDGPRWESEGAQCFSLEELLHSDKPGEGGAAVHHLDMETFLNERCDLCLFCFPHSPHRPAPLPQHANSLPLWSVEHIQDRT